MRRGAPAFAVLLVAVGVAACTPAPPPPPPVYVFWDSNLVIGKPYLKSGATVRALGGTAICDWFTEMKTDATYKPRVVIVAFGGNLRACSVGATRYDAYLADLHTVRSLFPSTTAVKAVIPFRTCPPTAPNDDVAQAVIDSALPTIDTRSITCAYVSTSDGIHLT